MKRQRRNLKRSSREPTDQELYDAVQRKFKFKAGQRVSYLAHHNKDPRCIRHEMVRVAFLNEDGRPCYVVESVTTYKSLHLVEEAQLR